MSFHERVHNFSQTESKVAIKYRREGASHTGSQQYNGVACLCEFENIFFTILPTQYLTSKWPPVDGKAGSIS